MKVVPRTIFIVKWDPPSISPVIQMTQTQTFLLTWWQEFKKRFYIVLTAATQNPGDFESYLPKYKTWTPTKFFLEIDKLA